MHAKNKHNRASVGIGGAYDDSGADGIAFKKLKNEDVNF